MSEKVRLPVEPDKLDPRIKDSLSIALVVEPPCYGDLAGFQRENFLAYFFGFR